VDHRLRDALSGQYEIDRDVGRGGMATVYLARDVKYSRRVAIKVPHDELAVSVGAARFLREIDTAAKLTHPHILSLHDSGERDGRLYYVMPYVEGESLRSRLNRERQLPLNEAVRIASDVADALVYAHAQGVLHRDIKPENILLTGRHAIVADFGIARAVEQAAGATLTDTGITLGTPHYMSPEQASAQRDLDGRSDVYALGCVLYEMLAGEAPYTGATMQAIVAKHLTAEVPSLRTLRPSTPARLDDIVRRALSKNAADRQPTAAAFLRDLEALQLPTESAPAPSAPPPVPAGRRPRVL
jgi:eukaryotic-like serine/threonine-protein kinase